MLGIEPDLETALAFALPAAIGAAYFARVSDLRASGREPARSRRISFCAELRRRLEGAL